MTASVYDSPDWLALVAGIIACPEADLPRLVAADWLSDRGEEDRGEFIRVQCEIRAFQVGPTPDGRDALHQTANRVHALLRRQQELTGPHVAGAWGENYHRWFVRPRDLHDLRQIHFGTAVVRRGFVAEVGCPLAWWVGTGRTPGHGPALVRRHPIERVTVTDREPWPRANGGYWWTTDDGARSDLPSAVVIEMSRRAGQPVWDRGRLAFRTGKAAALALSGSLIAGAKGGAP